MFRKSRVHSQVTLVAPESCLLRMVSVKAEVSIIQRQNFRHRTLVSCSMRTGHLKYEGKCGSVAHAKLTQAEGGGQVGSEEASPQHHCLVCIQMPANTIVPHSLLMRLALTALCIVQEQCVWKPVNTRTYYTLSTSMSKLSPWKSLPSPLSLYFVNMQADYTCFLPPVATS